jgi:hypothetical protein
MGMSDKVVMPLYSQKVSEYINENLEEGHRIAWLGQQDRNYTEMFDGIVSKTDIDGLEHHFYDIDNDQGGNSFKWDVHGPWNIEGYDLVVGLRILFLCSSAKMLVSNIKHTCSKNDRVVFDFMTGNPELIGGKTVFVKKNNSKTILPFFPDLYGEDFGVQSNHQDQIITQTMLTDDGIHLENLLTFRDTVKHRFYTLAELKIES